MRGNSAREITQAIIICIAIERDESNVPEYVNADRNTE